MYRVSHGNKLEVRREMLLAQKYRKQIQREKDSHVQKVQKQKRNGSSSGSPAFSAMSAIGCVIFQLQQDLQQEVVRIVNGVPVVVTSESSWTCLKCEWENDGESSSSSKCELCFQMKPSWHGIGKAMYTDRE